MIRNYYTDSYKDGVEVVPSDTLLLDGRTQAVIPQSNWVEYNLIVGGAPASTVTSNSNAASTNGTLILKSPNSDIKVGMFVGGVGVPADCKITAISVALGTMTITVDKTLGIAVNILLTFSFSLQNSVRVRTISNTILTFYHPVEGEVLPVSIVQVFSAGTNNVSGLVALN